MLLGIVGWVVVGLVLGFIASKMVTLHGDDPRLGIAVAIGGAIVVAALYSMISGAGVTAWNPRGLMFAGIGGVVAVVTWHAVRSRFITHEVQSVRKSY